MLHLLERYNLDTGLRGDGIYAVGRKTGPVRERYPVLALYMMRAYDVQHAEVQANGDQFDHRELRDAQSHFRSRGGRRKASPSAITSSIPKQARW